MRLFARRRSRTLALTLILLAVIWGVVGCTSTVKPPEDPVDPVKVYMIREDRHRGLVIPDAAGRLVEFGYGEWGWYALGKTRWYHVFDTILWPTRGTLGRHETHLRSEEALRRDYSHRNIATLRVERYAVIALRERLESEFSARADERVRNASLRMDFVPHPDGFWFLHNCNDAVGAWLRELECEVSWVPVRTDLRVESEDG